MDNLLILLGVLGFGAIIISIHVFADASRAYEHGFDGRGGSNGFRERAPGDRRSGKLVVFPLTLANNNLIHEDRRTLTDRRVASA